MSDLYSQKDNALWDHQQKNNQLTVYADIGPVRDTEDISFYGETDSIRDREDIKAKYNHKENRVIVEDSLTSERWDYELSKVEDELEGKVNSEPEKCTYHNGIVTFDFELEE